MATAAAEFDRSKLFGVLHDQAGTAVMRTVRVLKVGIGIPSGPDIHVWIGEDEKWHVATGVYQGNKRVKSDTKTFDGKAEAAAHYQAARQNAHERLYPARLAHFTFLRMGPTGYLHDFDAIEQHGPVPSEIDIVFLANDPFDYRFAYYTKAEMKCEGNGRDARRRITFAQTAYEEQLAMAAQEQGERFFALPNSCYTLGCPFGGKECKPHSTLFFQLQGDLRFGGDCTFATTGFRSTGDLYSSLERIKKATGRGRADDGRLAGIPLKLVLRPYRTSFTDAQGVLRSSTQYAASIEYRAGSALEAVGSMVTHADNYEDALQQGVPLQLGAMPEGTAAEEPIAGEVIEPLADEIAEDAALSVEAKEAAEAAAIASEFYPDRGGDRDDDDLDQFSQNGNGASAAPAMPQRKSAAQRTANQGAVELQSPLGFVQSPGLIEGVRFPAVVLAGAKDERPYLDDITLLTDEAERIGVGLTSFSQEILGLKPQQITREAGLCLLKLMRGMPGK
jgi:hypothetical protein